MFFVIQIMLTVEIYSVRPVQDLFLRQFLCVCDSICQCFLAALILSSGSDHVYSGAIFEYQNSFLLYLGLQDMGMFSAHGKENGSPEKLEELYKFGKSLTDQANKS